MEWVFWGSTWTGEDKEEKIEEKAESSFASNDVDKEEELNRSTTQIPERADLLDENESKESTRCSKVFQRSNNCQRQPR